MRLKEITLVGEIGLSLLSLVLAMLTQAEGLFLVGAFCGLCAIVTIIVRG